MAQQSEFGWILSGPIAQRNSITNTFRINHVSIDFNEAIQKFFQIESVPEVKAQSKADAYCEEFLYPGPVKLADLTAVLINWRCHRIAYMADITKMYRQIRIDESDITYQRIFWRSHPTDQIREYCLNRLTFGTNFAPSFAIMSLHHLAQLEREKFPHGAEVIANDMYMDDAMSGNSSVELALRDQCESISILKSAEMDLRKWVSNANELLEAVPESHREISVPLAVNGDESIKALGTYWNTSTDVFEFRVSIDDTKPSYTKRAIMSTICKLFDPLGLVSPVVAKAKMFMKEVWRSECDWDDVVSSELDVQWRKYLSELKAIKHIKVRRWIGYLPNSLSIQLHGFCDASTRAYGAHIYLRVIYPSNDIRTHLIISKSKIAPMTSPTIPRLELCGAVVLAELMQYVRTTIRHEQVKPADVKLWTDSQTVLQWLRSDPSRWDMFVSNRVMAIQKKSEVEQWQHVRTFDNPADLVSRGASPGDLKSSELWWFGPKWLQLPESEWPVPETENVEPIEEKRVRRIHTFTIAQMEYMERFSTLRKLIRSTAWFQRLIAILRKKASRFEDTLTAAELSKATIFWVKVVQAQAFAHEIRQRKKRYQQGV